MWLSIPIKGHGVIYGVHNHLASEQLEGQSFAGRLSKEKERLIVNTLQSLIYPRDILYTLKQKNKQNVSTIRTIYNEKKKFKVVKYARRLQIQRLMKNFQNTLILRFIEVVPILTLWKIFLGLTRLTLSYYMHFLGVNNGLYIQNQQVPVTVDGDRHRHKH